MTLVGASGTVAGVTGADGSDGGPSPTAFVATTVNVYAVPFVRPFTCALVAAPSTSTVTPSGADVIAYPVIGEPPSLAGADHITVALESAAIATTLVGAAGGPSGVTVSDGVDGALSPTAFVATTVNVYAVPS